MQEGFGHLAQLVEVGAGIDGPGMGLDGELAIKRQGLGHGRRLRQRRYITLQSWSTRCGRFPHSSPIRRPQGQAAGALVPSPTRRPKDFLGLQRGS